MDVIAINKLQYLQIGVQGENAANSAPIDMTEWVNEYPNSRFHLLFKPYNSTSPLPMVTTYDGETHILTWTPTLSATAVAGVGYTEVRALDVDSGVLKKSRIIPTSVENSVTGVEGGTVPLPYEDWVNLVLDYKDAAEDAQEAAETAQGLAETAQGKAEDAQEAAETAESNSEAWAVGQRDGTDVGSDDPTYHNNSKYYSGLADDAKDAAVAAQGLAENWATGGSSGTPGATNNSKYYSEQSASSASAASSAKDDAVAAKDALQGANATASTLQPGSSATASLSWTGGTANFAFGIPRGADGEDGEDGTDAYVYIKYAANQPTQDSDMKDTADAWMGIYSGSASSAPTTYTSYTWYKIKGENGSGSGTVTGVKMNGGSAIGPDAGGTVDLGTVLTSHQDISGKADKVSSPTSGNFAGLDSNGNLTDSGHKHSDYLTSAATVASGTLAAGSWTSATPPTQTISVTGVTASNNIIVSVASTATSAQYNAAVSGKLLCTAQGAGEITVTCYGTEPTENIPLSVLILG